LAPHLALARVGRGTIEGKTPGSDRDRGDAHDPLGIESVEQRLEAAVGVPTSRSCGISTSSKNSVPLLVRSIHSGWDLLSREPRSIGVDDERQRQAETSVGGSLTGDDKDRVSILDAREMAVSSPRSM